jgi:glycosyltransferase involved in cell wall biosynthesis
VAQSWHIVTGEYPPQAGGVADYTARLAEALAGRSQEVHVWRPSRASALGPRASEAGAAVGGTGAVVVHDIPGFGPRGLAAIGRALDQRADDRLRPVVLVQYAPNAFGMRGANVVLCAWLLNRALRRRDDVRVMFHEPFFYFGRQSLGRNALALVHRGMAALLLGASRVVYVSTGSWEALLSRYAAVRRPFVWLPVPATVTVPDDPDAVARARARAAVSPEAFVVGHFGSYPEDVSAELSRVLGAMLDASGDATVLCIGRNSDRFARDFARAFPTHAARVLATGELRPGEVAHHLRACDFLVQPYPDGATTRRTSLMAPLACGVPVVTTIGRWSEPVWRQAQDAVELVPVGDIWGLIARCQGLANDATRRQAIGRAARVFYERHFSLGRTVRILCGAPAGEPTVLVGVHVYPADGKTAARQGNAVAALAALERVRRANLQFGAGDTSIDVGGFETMRVLRGDSVQVTRKPGVRKPIASEVFDLLARRALEEGCRYFVYVNSETVLSQTMIDRIASGSADAYALARTDVGGGRPPEVRLAGVDGFAVRALWWIANGWRFRPHIIGEGVWDNVYAAQLACHSRTTFVYDTGALTHERHEATWTSSAFVRYTQYLGALDAPYFALWCTYYDWLTRAVAAGAAPSQLDALAGETFVWRSSLAARAAQAARGAKGWMRYRLAT